MTRRSALWLVTLLLALTGCSGMRIVDSDVTAFAGAHGLAVPASYRFERLPSQQSQGARHEWLESVARAELEKVGMQLGISAPQYSVSLNLRSVVEPRAPWDDPPQWGGLRGPAVIVTPGGTVIHRPFIAMQFNSPYYRREVDLLVRRLSDGAAVFESRAYHEGRWSDDEAVVPAMFEAALRDFPNPPQGVRRVVIEIPR